MPFNRNQKIALLVAAANVLVMLLFPPYDQYSIASLRLPIFAGFHFFVFAPPYSEVNTALLTLEIFVVLINAGIALLLLRERPPGARPRRFGYQAAVLIFTGANLVLVLLFPPFESVFAVTRAALPTFEGFYFIFARQPTHVIVTTLLYLEVIFILVNGALLWLIFRERRPEQITLEQLQRLAEKLERGRRG